jgi:hypothetical protein
MDSSEPTSSSANRGSRLQRLFIFSVAYLSVGVVALVSVFPWRPSTRSGWIIYFLLAPLACLTGDWLSERLTRPWWESTSLGKAAKAVLFVLVALVVLAVTAIVQD